MEREAAGGSSVLGSYLAACETPFIFFAGACSTAVGGLRGAAKAPEFAGFEAEDFVKSCGVSALGATALRTDTSGPPGQPMAAVPTWAVVGSAFVAVCWAWV